jgi:hypothetical protein
MGPICAYGMSSARRKPTAARSPSAAWTAINVSHRLGPAHSVNKCLARRSASALFDGHRVADRRLALARSSAKRSSRRRRVRVHAFAKRQASSHLQLRDRHGAYVHRLHAGQSPWRLRNRVSAVPLTATRTRTSSQTELWSESRPGPLPVLCSPPTAVVGVPGTGVVCWAAAVSVAPTSTVPVAGAVLVGPVVAVSVGMVVGVSVGAVVGVSVGVLVGLSVGVSVAGIAVPVGVLVEVTCAPEGLVMNKRIRANNAPGHPLLLSAF